MKHDVSQLPLVFVDLETTGGSPQASRVLEVAALKYQDGRVIDRFVQLLNPDQLIPPFITQLTGISELDTSSAPEFHTIAWELYDFLEGSVFVAHNAAFDYSFLREEYRRLGADFAPPRLCTVELSRHFYAHFQTHRLSAVIERHGIAVDQRHRAEADAQALVDFYGIIHHEWGEEAVRAACEKLLKTAH